MTRLHFSAADISLTVGIASLVALAIPLFLGWLSDHTGRKPLLLVLNLLGFAGLFLISHEKGLAGFCVASSLLSLYSCFSGLSNAMITDLVPKESLGLGLSLINSTSFIAGIFSSALVGLTINTLGVSTPFLLAMILPLTAGIFLSLIKENKQTSSFHLTED
jgi:MFS family permease